MKPVGFVHFSFFPIINSSINCRLGSEECQDLSDKKLRKRFALNLFIYVLGIVHCYLIHGKRPESVTLLLLDIIVKTHAVRHAFHLFILPLLFPLIDVAINNIRQCDMIINVSDHKYKVR